VHEENVDESNEHSDSDRDQKGTLGEHDVSEHISEGAASDSIVERIPVIKGSLRKRVLVRDAVAQEIISGVFHTSRRLALRDLGGGDALDYLSLFGRALLDANSVVEYVKCTKRSRRSSLVDFAKVKVTVIF